MRPVVLTILDGWGHSDKTVGNAIHAANTSTFAQITKNYPSLLLQASGQAVGMAFGETGNSEVGHLTLGAGRIIFQYFSRINKSIQNGEFYENPALLKAADHVSQSQATFHIVGLLTSGSVHAYLGHLEALIKFATDKGLKKINIHLFTDGRDSGLKEGSVLLKKLQDEIKSGPAKIVSVIGRDFAMDRDGHWDKIQAAYDLMVTGKGKVSNDLIVSLEENYQKGINDPDIPPLTTSPDEGIKSGDAVVFFNFREDSMRQILRPFADQNFDIFPHQMPENIYLATMTAYADLPNVAVICPAPNIENSLPEVMSRNKKNQFHIAESEKYAHVTFFFNGLKTAPFDGETDLFVDSLADPIEHPEMKAFEITDRVIKELDRDFYELFVINYANGDILAHLGNFDATVRGVEAVDKSIQMLKDAVLAKDGILIITADHGNAESLIYKQTGEKETRHDDSPVPLYIIAKEFERERSDTEIKQHYSNPEGLLSDVAPTILELMGIEKPVEMTGSSLLNLF